LIARTRKHEVRSVCRVRYGIILRKPFRSEEPTPSPLWIIYEAL
jgi:hypothetical protein